MTALVCEMCGGHDLIKQDGYYVCQNCGTKYTVEEAKKLMIDGVVEVTGTVKIDSDSKINNLYKLARRAKDENNSKNAAKYYGEILLEHPNDWEAQFFSAYFEAFGCKLGEIGNAAYKVANSITSVFRLIRENVPENERMAIFSDIRSRVIVLGSALYTSALDYALQYKASTLRDKVFGEVKYMVSGVLGMYSTLAVELEAEGDTEDAIALYKQCIERSNLRGIIIYSFNEKSALLEKIHKYDPNYSAPTEVGQGCYVATAVYGSYDCPEVWTLRRYRDYNLAKTWHGRVFIKTYYAISPTLVKWFGHTEWFKKMLKPCLNNMVAKLNLQGVEDTPYEDMKW